MPDKKEAFPNEGEYERTYDRDSANYELRPVEDSPIPGHMEQVRKEELEEED